MTEPISMYVPATLIAACAVPLVLKLVPPNRFYGFRTAHTLSDRKNWFHINRVAGIALILASGAAICLYLIEPKLSSGRSFPGMLALIVPVFSVLVAVGAYSRKHSHRSK